MCCSYKCNSYYFFFSSRRRHTRYIGDWSSDVCSSDLNAEVWIASNGGPNPWDSSNSWAPDTTWQVAPPWWRSGATLNLGAAQSFQVVTPGFTDRYLRHVNGLAVTEVVTAGSDATLKAAATFYVRRGP